MITSTPHERAARLVAHQLKAAGDRAAARAVERLIRASVQQRVINRTFSNRLRQIGGRP